MIVETVDSTAPAEAAPASAGVARMRAPIDPIVAVLDTKPPASPASGSPSLGPKIRMAT